MMMMMMMMISRGKITRMMNSVQMRDGDADIWLFQEVVIKTPTKRQR